MSRDFSRFRGFVTKQPLNRVEERRTYFLHVHNNLTEGRGYTSMIRWTPESWLATFHRGETVTRKKRPTLESPNSRKAKGKQHRIMKIPSAYFIEGTRDWKLTRREIIRGKKITFNFPRVGEKWDIYSFDFRIVSKQSLEEIYETFNQAIIIDSFVRTLNVVHPVCSILRLARVFLVLYS